MRKELEIVAEWANKNDISGTHYECIPGELEKYRIKISARKKLVFMVYSWKGISEPRGIEVQIYNGTSCFQYIEHKNRYVGMRLDGELEYGSMKLEYSEKRVIVRNSDMNTNFYL